jgi:uncharacterized Tic20 family protein
MLRYLACLVGLVAIVAVLPARGEAPVQPAPIQKQSSGQIQSTAQSPSPSAPVTPAGDQDNNSRKQINTSDHRAELLGGLFLLVLFGGLIAWQWVGKTPQVKDDEKALEALRIIYGFWLIVAALLVALFVLVITLNVIHLDNNTKSSDIVAIIGTVTGLITTLTAAFFGIQQAGAGRSQALTTLAQLNAPAPDGAMAGKLDPSYGPHAGGTKVSITGNGFTGATGANFGASPGANFHFENDGLLTVNSPPVQSKDNEAKVSIVFSGVSPPNREVGTFYYYTIDPTHGPNTGGEVKICGSGLGHVSAVKFGENDGTGLHPGTPDDGYMSGREFIVVTAPSGNQGSDVPVRVVFPVETGNKISVVGTYHYDSAG